MDEKNRLPEVAITKELASISLNPDGRVSITLDKKDFIEAISDAFVGPVADRPELKCPKNVVAAPKPWVCSKLCLYPRIIPTLRDILTLVDNGVLRKEDLTETQLQVVGQIRDSLAVKK